MERAKVGTVYASVYFKVTGVQPLTGLFRVRQKGGPPPPPPPPRSPFPLSSERSVAETCGGLAGANAKLTGDSKAVINLLICLFFPAEPCGGLAGVVNARRGRERESERARENSNSPSKLSPSPQRGASRSPEALSLSPRPRPPSPRPHPTHLEASRRPVAALRGSTCEAEFISVCHGMWSLTIECVLLL
jgi:hypothetical protein